MLFNNKHKNEFDVLHVLYTMLYRNGNEFINDIIDGAFNRIEDKNEAKAIISDVFEYALSKGMITIKSFLKDERIIIFNKDNYKQFINLIDDEWGLMTDRDNFSYHYSHYFYYTDSWKEELKNYHYILNNV